VDQVALFERPGNAVALPDGRSHSWRAGDKAASPGQRRLVAWLDHLDAIAAHAAAGPGPLAVELTVGLPGCTARRGRPRSGQLPATVVQRIGPNRVTAAFARKIRGRSSLAIAPTQPAVDRHGAGYTVALTGSSDGTRGSRACATALRQPESPRCRPGRLRSTDAGGRPKALPDHHDVGRPLDGYRRAVVRQFEGHHDAEPAGVAILHHRSREVFVMAQDHDRALPGWQ
jgi:hypothetical protein